MSTNNRISVNKDLFPNELRIFETPTTLIGKKRVKEISELIHDYKQDFEIVFDSNNSYRASESFLRSISFDPNAELGKVLSTDKTRSNQQEAFVSMLNHLDQVMNLLADFYKANAFSEDPGVENFMTDVTRLFNDTKRNSLNLIETIKTRLDRQSQSSINTFDALKERWQKIHPNLLEARMPNFAPGNSFSLGPKHTSYSSEPGFVDDTKFVIGREYKLNPSSFGSLILKYFNPETSIESSSETTSQTQKAFLQAVISMQDGSLLLHFHNTSGDFNVDTKESDFSMSLAS